MRKWLFFLSALVALGLGCHRRTAPTTEPATETSVGSDAQQGGMQTTPSTGASAGDVPSTVVRPPNDNISPNLPQAPLDSLKKQQLEGKYQVIPDTSKRGQN